LRARAARVALVGAALASGAVGWAGLLDTRPLLQLPPRLGTNFAFFEAHFRYAGGWRERIALAREVDPGWDAYRPLAYRCLAPEGSALGPATRVPGPGAWKAVQALPAELRPYALVHLGHRAVAEPGPARMIAALDALPDDLAAEQARWYRLGVGRGMMLGGLSAGVSGERSLAAFYQVLDGLAPEHAPDVLTGAGFQLGFVFSPYNDNLVRTLAPARRLSAPGGASFHAGVALGWRMRFREATWYVPAPDAAKIERLLAPADRAAFRAGLALSADGFGPS
jgi:hypothetical protein